MLDTVPWCLLILLRMQQPLHQWKSHFNDCLSSQPSSSCLMQMLDTCLLNSGTNVVKKIPVAQVRKRAICTCEACIVVNSNFVLLVVAPQVSIRVILPGPYNNIPLSPAKACLSVLDKHQYLYKSVHSADTICWNSSKA